MKILIMGLPGSGKTTLADQLRLRLTPRPAHLNADKMRALYDDWDFSPEGRRRQAERMTYAASTVTNSICDFICPTEELRVLFAPDIVIWMDTIKVSRFPDTDALFVPPAACHWRIGEYWNASHWSTRIANVLMTEGGYR